MRCGSPAAGRTASHTAALAIAAPATQPVEMRERHLVGNDTSTATATYGRFRRFGVTTQETIGP